MQLGKNNAMIQDWKKKKKEEKARMITKIR